MTTRFQPPNNPLSDHTPDAETAQIRRGVGTRSIGDLLKHWQALALLVLVGAGTVYAAWHLIGWGWPVLDVLFWAAVVLVLCGAGAWWVLLKFRQDLWQFTAIKDNNANKQRVEAEYWDTLLTQAKAYARRWYREQTKPGIVIGGDQIKASAAAAQSAQADAQSARQEAAQIAAAFATIQQQAQHALLKIAAAGEPPKARVVAPDLATTELPDRPPMPEPRRVPYIGTDLEAIMAVVFSGGSPSRDRFMAQGWSRPQWAAAIEALKTAGILTGQGRGWGLSADFAGEVAGAEIDQQHDAVMSWLARNPPSPSHPNPGPETGA